MSHGITNGRMLKSVTTLLVTLLLSLILSVPAMAYDEVTIVIDPGHGGEGEDDATYRGAIYHDLYEKDINLITATAFYEELSQYGNVNVYMTRNDDRKLTLQERVDYAKTVNADYLISVHYNASAHHRFYGSEIFTSAFGEEYARGYSIADSIMSWWEESGSVSKDIKTRIGKKGTDYYGLIRIGREEGIPTIILEHGYLDHDKDFNKLNTEESWKKMGVMDASAVADYLGVKKGVVVANLKRDLVVDVPSERIEPDVTPPEQVTLTIDDYDPDSGVLNYTVTGLEPESKLMYFGLDTKDLALDEDEGFMDLQVWDKGADSMQGTYAVPDGYEGGFVARVYNNYELFTDTAPVFIPDSMLPVTESETVIGTMEVSPPSEEVNAAEPEEESTSEGGWSLANVFSKDKKKPYVDETGDRQTGRSNYIGMIVAFSIAGLMLIVSIVMAIASAVGRRRRR